MTTEAITHGTSVVPVERPGYVRRECPCGWQSSEWNPSHAPGIRTEPGHCPEDPTVRSLATLQFASGGLLDARPVDGYAVHLVRRTVRGTPGPTLCGIDRFAPGSAGWSVGGGMSGRDIVHTPCPGCLETARTEFPGLPVSGFVGAKEMRAAIDEADAEPGRACPNCAPGYDCQRGVYTPA